MDQLALLYRSIKIYKRIYIYGAGVIGQRVYNWLKSNSIEISGYLVTRETDSDHDSGIFCIGEVENIDECAIVLGMSDGNVREVQENILKKLNAGRIIVLTSEQKTEINRINDYEYRFTERSEYYYIDSHSYYLERYMSVLLRKNDLSRLFRVFTGYIQNVEDIISRCTEEEFNKLNVPICYLQHNISDAENIFDDADGFEIYIATSHYDDFTYHQEESSWIPLQVGAVLTSERKGCVMDCVGDNISSKNRDYCECTGLYWIWKNTSGQEYVGINHYRRRLLVTLDDIDYIIDNKTDIIVAYPQFVGCKAKDFFLEGGHITQQDWKIMCERVIKFDGFYSEIIKEYEDSYFYFSCNLAIMKREIFDRYCEFAFSIAFGIEKHYTDRGIIREDRYMGYIFENLLTLFIIRHRNVLNVAATDVIWLL